MIPEDVLIEKQFKSGIISWLLCAKIPDFLGLSGAGFARKNRESGRLKL